MTEREIELQAKLEQAERALAQARDGAFANIAEAEVIKLANRASAAESALAAAQGALREAVRQGEIDREKRARANDNRAATKSALREARVVIGFLRSCVRSGESLSAADDARIDAALAAEPGKPGGEAQSKGAPTAQEAHMVKDCTNCGGTHYGDFECPYLTSHQQDHPPTARAPAPPALPAELSGKGEQRAYSHEHVFDTQLLCKVCGGCALDLAEEAAEPGEAKKEEP